MRHLLMSVLLLSQTLLIAQNKAFKVEYYYPKDSVKFNQKVYSLGFNDDNDTYGKTTMIIHCESAGGDYDFVFKKKILEQNRVVEFDEGNVNEKFNLSTNKWEYEEGSLKREQMKSKPIDTVVTSLHNLYAAVYAHDHGGLLKKAEFRDFGNPVYWPEFDYPHCSISDEDKDGGPEFYLSYLGDHDGMDAVDYKQITYAYPPGTGKPLIKSKATASYASISEDGNYQKYKITYDANWKALPAAIQQKSKRILAEHKKKYEAGAE